jgi:hypothetical protein
MTVTLLAVFNVSVIVGPAAGTCKAKRSRRGGSWPGKKSGRPV